MKRTCKGCRAVTESNGHMHCLLGYKTKTQTEYEGFAVSIKPTEECPKPTTIDLFVYEMNAGRREKPN